MSGDLFKRIRDLGKLTATETKLARHFERNYQRLGFESLTAMAEKAEVSKASVVRFISHRLGYRDFAEFQAERQEELEYRLVSPIDRYMLYRSKHPGRLRNPLEEHLPTVIGGIQGVYDQIKGESILEAVDLVSQSDRPLYLLGQRTSFSLAYMFYINLQYVRPGVHLLGGPNTRMPVELLDLEPGGVAFVISKRRYTTNSLRITRKLKEAGTSIVLMADSGLSPLVQYADLVMVVPSDDPSSFESICAWAVVIESIFLAAADILKEKEAEYARNLEKTLNEFDTFLLTRRD